MFKSDYLMSRQANTFSRHFRDFSDIVETVTSEMIAAKFKTFPERWSNINKIKG